MFQSQDNSGKSAFKAKLHAIEAYCDYKKLTGSLKLMIMNHHRHVYSQQKTLDVNTVMQDLPTPLQMEIAMFIHRRIIHKVPLLRDCSVTIQKNVALRLKPQFAEAFSFVYEAGDIGRDIYFILSGAVVMHMSTNTKNLDLMARRVRRRESVREILTTGDNFGEDVLVTSTGTRLESAKALDNSYLFTLSKGDADWIMDMLGPEAKVTFLARLLKRGKFWEQKDDSECEEEEEEEEEEDDKMVNMIPFAEKPKFRLLHSEGSDRNFAINNEVHGKLVGLGLSVQNGNIVEDVPVDLLNKSKKKEEKKEEEILPLIKSVASGHRLSLQKAKVDEEEEVTAVLSPASTRKRLGSDAHYKGE